MRGEHPSKDILSSDGSELADKKIVLCITGSVAAYRAIDMARLLMRHGADVHAVMSQSTASMLLHADMMEWVTGNKAVTKLTGSLEHVALADYDMSDLIIVYPCTANTIGKAANGIDDTPVTSVLSVALGSKIPVIIAPAMHEAMYGNEFIQQNIKKLKRHVTFVGPTIEESKAKVVEPEDVLRAAVTAIGKTGPLVGKKILITAGSTAEQIDPIRVITNASSGKMGFAIARQAESMGAQVTLVYGRGTEAPLTPKVIRVSTGEDMHDAVTTELKKGYDVVIMAAAIADFKSSSKSSKKLDTRTGGLKLSLTPTRKIVDEFKKIDDNIFLVAFKAEWNVSNSVLIDKAFKKLNECKADLVVANDLCRKGSGAGSDMSEVFIVDVKKRTVHVPLSSKQQVARRLLEIVSQKLKHN
jgi:phosphopantothenoylcysteine decarboxylase / phosphopantothenate---cysteine ligase